MVVKHRPLKICRSFAALLISVIADKQKPVVTVPGHILTVCIVCQFEFKKPAVCQKVCTKTYDTNNPSDKAKLDFLKKGMLLNYQHHWYV